MTCCRYVTWGDTSWGYFSHADGGFLWKKCGNLKRESKQAPCDSIGSAKLQHTRTYERVLGPCAMAVPVPATTMAL